MARGWQSPHRMHVRPSIPLLLSLALPGCLDEAGRRPDPDTPFAPMPGDEDGDEDTGGGTGGADVGPGLSHPPAPPWPDLPDDGPPSDPEVCYPGPIGDWSVCLPLVEVDPLPAGYVYPEPMAGMWNYRTPVAYLDLDALDPDTMLAPHFRLGEIARAWKGRYAVVQPHAVERLEALRDEAGALKVDSGYRPPTYNAMIGGAAYSRHMYGDAFDLEPLDATSDELESLCVELDGHLFQYDTHVHCDWRDEPLDERFFGVGE